MLKCLPFALREPTQVSRQNSKLSSIKQELVIVLKKSLKNIAELLSSQT